MTTETISFPAPRYQVGQKLYRIVQNRDLYKSKIKQVFDGVEWFRYPNPQYKVEVWEIVGYMRPEIVKGTEVSVNTLQEIADENCDLYVGYQYFLVLTDGGDSISRQKNLEREGYIDYQDDEEEHMVVHTGAFYSDLDLVQASPYLQTTND